MTRTPAVTGLSEKKFALRLAGYAGRHRVRDIPDEIGELKKEYRALQSVVFLFAALLAN